MHTNDKLKALREEMLVHGVDAMIILPETLIRMNIYLNSTSQGPGYRDLPDQRGLPS
ncbi:MAG: hypothetical protein UZ08_BCD001002338 [Candidatus Parvibacillus calidus]|nr:MAG: hypothetical protein UZ08_BCD001002338 [Candidatus Parvibacillus calidus]